MVVWPARNARTAAEGGELPGGTAGGSGAAQVVAVGLHGQDSARPAELRDRPAHFAAGLGTGGDRPTDPTDQPQVGVLLSQCSLAEAVPLDGGLQLGSELSGHSGHDTGDHGPEHDRADVERGGLGEARSRDDLHAGVHDAT